MKSTSLRPAALCGLALLALSPVARAAEAATQPGSVALADTPAPSVVVTATRFPEDANRLPFGVSVITGEELRRSGTSTVNEALVQLLGLPGRIDLTGGGNTIVDLRGFGVTAESNQVVIVDGLRINEADTTSPQLAQLPLEAIERIEVIRGNAAVLYGEGATGGAIVITTRAGGAGAQRTGGQVRAAAGSYGLRELRGSVTAVMDEFSLDAAAQRRNADNYRANARTELEAGSLGGQWRRGDLRVGARISADTLDARLPGELTAAQYASDPRQSFKPDDWGKIRNQRRSVFADTKLGGWTLGLDAGWRDKESRSVSVYNGFASPYDYDIDANNQSLRARNELSLGATRHTLVLGVDRNRWERHVLGAFGSQARQRSVGVYAKDDVDLSRDTRLSLGLRSESFRKEDSSSNVIDDRLPAWDLGLTQALGGGVAVYGRVGRSFRLANADEFNFTRPADVLRPQTSRDAELGLRWAHRQGRVEARVYRSALRDEIGYDPTIPNAGSFSGKGANVNLDRTRRQGLEIEARQALSAAVDLRVNAAWRQAKFTSGPHEGNELALVPKSALAVNLDWTPLPQHRLGLGVQLVSSQHPDFDGLCRVPGYATANARYAYQWRDAEFALTATNLGDRRFYTQAYGCVGGVTTSIYPEPGRAATASVTLRF
jgi:iron complex outermembrane receptor protein